MPSRRLAIDFPCRMRSSWSRITWSSRRRTLRIRRFGALPFGVFSPSSWSVTKLSPVTCAWLSGPTVIWVRTGPNRKREMAEEGGNGPTPKTGRGARRSAVEDLGLRQVGQPGPRVDADLVADGHVAGLAALGLVLREEV